MSDNKFGEEFEKKREELRTEMCNLQDAARVLRDQIDMMDREKDSATRESILGKSFRMNARSFDDGSPSWHGYARVEGFDEELRPYGTVINPYCYTIKGKRHKVIYVEINHSLHEDWILNGVQIRDKKFDRLLNDVKKSLNL